MPVSKRERQLRDVIYAVARVEPSSIHPSDALQAQADREHVREQYVEAVANALGVELEEALLWADVARMVA